MFRVHNGKDQQRSFYGTDGDGYINRDFSSISVSLKDVMSCVFRTITQISNFRAVFLHFKECSFVHVIPLQFRQQH